MKYTFLFLISVVCHITVSAQRPGAVKGRITTSDGKPAADITVAIKNKEQNTMSNEKGEYSLHRIKAGNYVIRVSGVGVNVQEKEITIETGKTTIADFILNGSPQVLNEIRINGRHNRYRATKPSPSLRLNEPLLEIPQNIQVITAKALADQQIISMNDGVLRNVSGSSYIEHWGDLYARINMRGSRASAFRNGMNITSSWGPLTEDMSFVDHIEFVKGPAGFMMSNGEPSGIYNIVTKKPTGQDFNGEATVTLGSYDLYRTTLDLDGKMNKSGKLLYRLNVMGQSKNSFRNYEFNDRVSFAPVITYKIDEQTVLTAEYNYQGVKMSNVGSYYVFATDGYATLPRNFTIAEPGLDPTKISDHSAYLNLQHQIDNNWKLTAQLAYFNYQQRGSSSWVNSVASNGNLIRSISIWDAANEAKFGQVYLNGDIKTGGIQHRILAGLDLGTKRYMADYGQQFALDTEKSPFNVFNPKYGSPANGLPVFDRGQSLAYRAKNTITDQSYTGIYVQDELGFLANRIRLTLAGRYTYVKESSGVTTQRENNKFTPRIGLSANINKSTTAYALFDQSFVPQSGSLRTGENPLPITGNNIEFGLKKDWFDGKWNTTLAAYRILKNNTLTPDPSNSGTESFVVNLGQTKTQGIEFDLQGEITTGLNLIANYAYTDSKISKASNKALPNAQVGATVPGYAKHNINTWLSYTLQHGPLKGSGISAGFNYQTNRTTWTWAGASTAMALPNFFKLDGGLFWEKAKVRVTANVYNILDKYLYSGAAYSTYYYWQAQAPRNYRLSIAYKF